MEQSDLKDLESLLKKSFNDKLIVKWYDVKSFLPPGENYGSKIVSVDAVIIRNKDYNESEEKIHLIAKLPPITLEQRDMFDSSFTFKKEIFMYDEILPAYKKLEIENGINEKDVFNGYAIYYGSRLSLNSDDEFDDDAAILLQNLKFKNYYCTDRKVGCDFKHAKIATKALAVFHALGIAIKHAKPDYFKILKDHCKCVQIKNPEDWESIVKSIFNCLLDDEELKEYHESCKAALTVGDPSYFLKLPEEPWSSIIHSDFWPNNFMFHKSEITNEPDDIKFIDFQNYLFLSPTREFAFFLECSVNDDVMNNHVNYLIDLYYETLIQKLCMLNIDIELYSRDTFDERLCKDARIELTHSLCILKIITMNVNADDPDALNVKNLLQFSKENEIFRSRLRNLILMLHKQNWLNE